MIMPYTFEITNDKEFLRHFLDVRDIFRLSPEMVEKLRRDEGPYGRYGYGQWLYRVRPEGDASLIEAKKCFCYAADNGVAEATQMLSIMKYYGDFYNEDKGGIWEMNKADALILNVQAQKEGSELARLRHNYDLFMGNLVPEDSATAIREALQEAEVPGASLLWLEQLGWFYEIEGRTEDAIKAYEKCIENGLNEPLYDLALIYYKRGNIGYFESLMEEGVQKGIASCMLWGIEDENDWDEYDDATRKELHERLAVNLRKGMELGNGVCAFALATYLTEGTMGFEKNIEEGLQTARKGISYHNSDCCNLILDYVDDDEYLMTILKAVRYGDESVLESVMDNSDTFIDMGYGDEIRIWAYRWEEVKKNAGSDETENEDMEEIVEKTEIVPTILIIQPSGFTDFVEEDVYPMSFREMAALIDAEGLDAVHFSEPLTQITEACGLKKNVTMYVDRDGFAKDLENNAVGTMLYGHGQEIRGAVIIAMEDSRYDTYSFDTEEDIENIFEAIFDFTGGILMRDLGQGEGRYDPWA